MWDYIIHDYFGNITNGQYWTIVGDILLYIYLAIVFCYRKRDGRGILMRLAEFMSVWAVRIFLSALIYVIPGMHAALTGFNTLYVVFPIVIFFYIAVWSREKIQFRVVKGFAFYAFYILGFGFAYDIMSMVGSSFASAGVVRELIHALCMFLICCAMRKNDMRGYNFVSASSMILITTLSVLGIVMSLLGRILLDAADKKTEYFVAAFHILFFATEVVGYLLFCKSIKEYSRRMETEIEKKIAQGGRELIALADANISELRGIRHDVKNQYEIMTRLIERGEYEKLREYFSEYSSAIEESIRGGSSGNTVFDCMMTVEYAKAESRGVTIDDVFAVPPTMPIDDVDLCGIMFNIVDNAIEAAAAFDEPEKRRVALSVRMHGEFLMIKCENAVKTDGLKIAGGEYVSSKPECGHGYGLKIVRGLVNKHDGEMRISAENGMFTVEIMLQKESA